jgi:hypothetical protein
MTHLNPGRAALLAMVLMPGTAGAAHAQNAQPVLLEHASLPRQRPVVERFSSRRSTAWSPTRRPGL